MQILVFSLIILIVVIFIGYKIKSSYTKNEVIGFFSVITILILAYSYYDYSEQNKLANSFKAYYLKEKQLEISKLTYEESNNEMLSSNTKKNYNFVYIIEKNEKLYLCEAKNVQTHFIVDEYVFKKFTEECQEKL